MKMFGILGILMKSSAQQCGGTSVPLVDLAFLLENLKWLFKEKENCSPSLEDISCEINKVTDTHIKLEVLEPGILEKWYEWGVK